MATGHRGIWPASAHSLAVWDWERSRIRGPVGFDSAFFRFQVDLWIRGLQPEQALWRSRGVAGRDHGRLRRSTRGRARTYSGSCCLRWRSANWRAWRLARRYPSGLPGPQRPTEAIAYGLAALWRKAESPSIPRSRHSTARKRAARREHEEGESGQVGPDDLPDDHPGHAEEEDGCRDHHPVPSSEGTDPEQVVDFQERGQVVADDGSGPGDRRPGDAKPGDENHVEADI